MSKKQPNKPLTARGIDTMKLGMTLADTGENRGLRVTRGKMGICTFFYRYTSPITGKDKQILIGHYPVTTLADARVRLHELKIIRKQGRYPRTELDEEKKQLKLEKQKVKQKPVTVKDVVELYLTERIEDRKDSDGKLIRGARKVKGQKECRRTLEGDAIRVLGHMEAMAVTRKDVVELVNSIVERGARVQAGNVMRELSLAYDFAIARQCLDEHFVNPAMLAKSSIRQARTKVTCNRRARFLSEKELSQFLQWLPGSVYPMVIKNVLRLALWTGCRTGELCQLSWDDVDLEKGTIHLAERDTKTSISWYVQLSTQAIDFLKMLQLCTGKYLFPSSRTKLPIQQKYLTESAWHLRQAGGMIQLKDHWTPHDLRRTVRTGLSRLKCPSDIAEAIVGHTKGGVEGIYNLHTYEGESREWLQKWADYLDGLQKA
ncbi:tyrosine-type recombinase/integrase [Escherichia fergusonii]|uniref:tyrosine-type recombinase/integrase n=1 Tax=Escherichia fergusonii TaxID=564 RepID=UPI003F6DA547